MLFEKGKTFMMVLRIIVPYLFGGLKQLSLRQAIQSHNTTYKNTGDEELYDNVGHTCPTSGIQLEENVFCPVCE